MPTATPEHHVCPRIHHHLADFPWRNRPRVWPQVALSLHQDSSSRSLLFSLRQPSRFCNTRPAKLHLETLTDRLWSALCELNIWVFAWSDCNAAIPTKGYLAGRRSNPNLACHLDCHALIPKHRRRKGIVAGAQGRKAPDVASDRWDTARRYYLFGSNRLDVLVGPDLRYGYGLVVTSRSSGMTCRSILGWGNNCTNPQAQIPSFPTEENGCRVRPLTHESSSVQS